MNKVEKLISEIAKLDPENITKDQIIDVACQFGLVNDSGSYGIYSQYMNKTRRETGIYQQPNQIADVILELLKHKIESYVEIGVFQGGNFLLVTEFLKLKNPKLVCFGIDITDSYMEDYVKPYIDLRIGTSKDFKGEKFDVVHIDGDHQYESAKEDWENLGQHAKICMIHDINQYTCPGVIRFWKELKEGKNVKEFTEHTTNVQMQGTGIVFNVEPVVSVKKPVKPKRKRK
jgi:hypothetical protein